MKCPECGYSLPEDSIFCQYCGIKLNNRMITDATSKKEQYCKQCGHIIDAATNKCTGCGKQYSKVINAKAVWIIIIALTLLVGVVEIFINTNTPDNKKKKLTSTTQITSTSTAKRTQATAPTKAPATETREFELKTIPTITNGSVTVKWTDSAGKAPYAVTCRQILNNGTKTKSYWAGGTKSLSTTYSLSFTVNNLAPGRKYEITVADCDGKQTSKVFVIPTANMFVDGKLTDKSISTEIYYRSKSYNAGDKTTESIQSLSASAIARDMGQTDYGIRYEIDYPPLAYSREYFTQIFVVSPDGAAFYEVFDTLPFGKEYSGRYWYIIGDWAFSRYYEINHTIPIGTWTVELYFDGMLANKNTFYVK